MPDHSTFALSRFGNCRTTLPALPLLFFGSGCAALIYEIVWFQMLGLVIGSSAVSIGVLLSTFMGGMCLGSYALPRMISPTRHPLRVYAALELGIGVCGMLLLWAIPAFGFVYSSHIASGYPGILLRGLVCAVLLLPPTVLMGATLPAIARYVESTPRGISWLGWFYSGNIAGAVFGCLLAGFYLLRIYDMAVATWTAAGINLLAAAVGWLLAWNDDIQTTPVQAQEPDTPGTRRVYIAIAVSGACALGAEVLWTRLLSLMLGATVYTFSIILAVFLTGLGIGSSAGAYLAQRLENPRQAFGLCQAMLVMAIVWAAWMLNRSIPYWPVSAELFSDPFIQLPLDILRTAAALLPAACLWGASFPLALAAAATKGRDPGRLAGGIYAANTVGAIIGALGCSMVMIPWLGTLHAHRLLMGLSAITAGLLLWPELRRNEPADVAGMNSKQLQSRRVLAASGAFILAAILIWQVPAVPPELIAYGRKVQTLSHDKRFVFTGEGVNASIAISELDGGIRNFHVSGKVVASSDAFDMRVQRMLGHLPALLHPHPKSILVVGCGAGVTAGTFIPYPEVEKIVICEIEPLIPETAARWFTAENHGVLRDPRTTVVVDDARHYLLTTRETFDIITSDPIHPWVKGAATLYTQEYFELVARHLNSGGIVTQWVPLYESTEEAVKSELATFFRVFPEGTIWSNDADGGGYDIVLLGGPGARCIDVTALRDRWCQPDHANVAQSLLGIGLRTPIEMLSTYAGRSANLAPWLADAAINRDRNLRLQYLSGLGLNEYMENVIYDHMLQYCAWPADLFRASDNDIEDLVWRIMDR